MTGDTYVPTLEYDDDLNDEGAECRADVSSMCDTAHGDALSLLRAHPVDDTVDQSDRAIAGLDFPLVADDDDDEGGDDTDNGSSNGDDDADLDVAGTLASFDALYTVDPPHDGSASSSSSVFPPPPYDFPRS